MSARALLLSVALGLCVLLAGAAAGLRQDQSDAATLSAPAGEAAAPAVLPAASVPDAVSAAAPVAAPVGPAAVTSDALPTPKDAPAAMVIPEMKHVWQSLNNCGPAAVVMALSTFGVDANQEVARLALRGPDVRRGMGPQGVDAWVSDNFGLRSMWRNDGTNDLMRRLVANGFVPMVTQWMQDPSVSRIAHWRTIRGYDDNAGVFYVNDSMLGNQVPLSYDWFARNWQSFSYRYMVIYRPEDAPLLQAVIGKDWSETIARQSLYERTRTEALAQNTNFAWLAYGEAAYANGVFDEAVAAFEKGFNTGSATGVFGVRNSYPQALRALGRKQEADAMAQKLTGITPVPSTVAPAPDTYALFLAIRRMTPYETLPTE
jgi:peptidase C39-like protein